MDAQLCVASGHEPEYYNDDQAWGDAIARAVAASSQVGAWPGALRRLCDALSLTVGQLMLRPELVIGFKSFGLAEAEVIELLLKVSPALHGLTLHDGGLGQAWDARQWARCTAAISRGIGATR